MSTDRTSRRCGRLTSGLVVLPVLAVLAGIVLPGPCSGMSPQERANMRERVRGMFNHAYDNYMTHAFPHDELKPLSESFTDSLAELGNLKLEHLSDSYRGSALTLVDSLSSLAVLGNASEFRRVVQWLGRHLSFDSDVRVNVFECTIRLLGGLVSGHLLALQEPLAHSETAWGASLSEPPYTAPQQPQTSPLARQMVLTTSGVPPSSLGADRDAAAWGNLAQEAGLAAGPGLGPAARPMFDVAVGSGGKGSLGAGVCLGQYFGGLGVSLLDPMQCSCQGGAALPPKERGNCSETAALAAMRMATRPGGGTVSPGAPAQGGEEAAEGSGSWWLGPGSQSEGEGEGEGEAGVPAHSPGWYHGELLGLAKDLGDRLLAAFDTPTGIPYAWVNLRHGVRPNETTETSTSCAGTLLLEFGLLSRLTGNPAYQAAAKRSLRRVWGMRSRLDLVGTTLDVAAGQWREASSGIGAGVDSFYEYLLKAYVLFGDVEAWDMFQAAYAAVQRHFRVPPPLAWYQDANFLTGRPTYRMFTSLQAFWPALQVLAGDISAANETHRQFYSLWQKYGLLPERYLYDVGVVHPTQKHYPLRPELAESTYALYHATKDPWYLEVGRQMVEDLERRTRVPGGYASVKDVETGEHEDHQHSFFLSEMCKYLYMLYDDEAVERLGVQNFVFSTEGHILPVLPEGHEQPVGVRAADRRPEEEQGLNSYGGAAAVARRRRRSAGNQRANALDRMVCPNVFLSKEDFHGASVSRAAAEQSPQGVEDAAQSSIQGSTGGRKGTSRRVSRAWRMMPESICHVLDRREDHRCAGDPDCGVEASSCRRRTCSPASYCTTVLV